jgi:hypothetical protein
MVQSFKVQRKREWFKTFKPFNRCAPLKTFQPNAGSNRSSRSNCSKPYHCLASFITGISPFQMGIRPFQQFQPFQRYLRLRR